MCWVHTKQQTLLSAHIRPLPGVVVELRTPQIKREGFCITYPIAIINFVQSFQEVFLTRTRPTSGLAKMIPFQTWCTFSLLYPFRNTGNLCGHAWSQTQVPRSAL